MHRVLAIAVIASALLACKSAVTRTEGGRPVSVTDAQVAATLKALGELEALDKDIRSAGQDCDKIALAMKSHAAALKAAGDALVATRVDFREAAVNAYFRATYAARMVSASAGFSAAEDGCPLNEAFIAAAKQWSNTSPAGALVMAMGIREGFDLYVKAELAKSGEPKP